MVKNLLQNKNWKSASQLVTKKEHLGFYQL